MITTSLETEKRGGRRDDEGVQRRWEERRANSKRSREERRCGLRQLISERTSALERSRDVHEDTASGEDEEGRDLKEEARSVIVGNAGEERLL